MFDVLEIASITGGNIHGDYRGRVSAVSTDSRTVKAGELFVPLRGGRFNGHDFLGLAADNGVKVTLADEEVPLDAASKITIIRVSDTLRALGDLAGSYRKRFNIAVVGISGSNGKTTTREMLAAILSNTAKGLKTAGNLNNLIGLPQMLFKLNSEHGWAVLEMGMSELGEIERLAEIAAPQIGIVLNAFPAHLESMKSVENVARAKGELLLRLPIGGTAMINADDPLIARQPSGAGVKRLLFGLEKGDVWATDVVSLGVEGQRFKLCFPKKSYPVSLRSPGKHSLYNALAAAGAAYALGIDHDLICRGLEEFRSFDKRFQFKRVGGLILIDDSYNANPASMEAALTTLGEIKGDRRVFVALGDMLELGGDENEFHRNLGMQAAKIAHRLYLYGNLTAHTAEGALSAGMAVNNVIRASSHDEIAVDVLARAGEGDFILIKGSRGMRMDKVAEEIRNMDSVI